MPLVSSEIDFNEIVRWNAGSFQKYRISLREFDYEVTNQV